MIKRKAVRATGIIIRPMRKLERIFVGRFFVYAFGGAGDGDGSPEIEPSYGIDIDIRRLRRRLKIFSFTNQTLKG